MCSLEGLNRQYIYDPEPSPAEGKKPSLARKGSCDGTEWDIPPSRDHQEGNGCPHLWDGTLLRPTWSFEAGVHGTVGRHGHLLPGRVRVAHLTDVLQRGLHTAAVGVLQSPDPYFLEENNKKLFMVEFSLLVMARTTVESWQLACNANCRRAQQLEGNSLQAVPRFCGIADPDI